ncbi:MAG TPA: Gfo/Idh/MocA family oxidoreductase [Candidatus Hydrogenedentes bacterium]|nr:Gfo/Idh/MocA family oxidoreductase [Candidatus Hydrogenedentota bacterium]HPC18108.1 Gfo/Idh/MocA family oxidoreductase [Candidatus Hydrogenedentota bacterium]HRT20652.1 Gfo/Idh/MocA family oxidoreductase [Candidatus Hydrogenedentota bacterium]HRT65687.1 Gfo/Idh/MocA family oxidoreductase [Candidatus Hydrogenedentota bacterium]
MSESNEKQSLTRRQFIFRGGAVAAGLAAAPTIITSRAWGAAKRAPANERLVMGVIGLGGRGRYVMGAFLSRPDVQVVGVCDVIKARRLQGQDIVNKTYGNQDCKAYIDMLELLDRKDIDIVLIATGDNWHSAASILAARAGKDIYCEKPMSVCISESRAVADTMRRLGRIYQCGTQRRSVGHFIFAANLALSGKLGRIKELHAEEASGFQQLYDTTLPAEPEPPREEFDWNRWLGPAQWRPFNSKYHTRGFWSAHTDFSGGSITEWGSHTVDLCQWANSSDDTSPVEFWKEGDRYIGRYANGTKLIIRTGLRFGSCPVRFEGEEGYVETGDSGEMEVYPKSLLGERKFLGGYPADDHVRAFLECVKTRQQTVSNAEVAHRSITACHVANICKRLGRPIKWDPVKEECIGDDEANRLRSRAYREPWYL